MTNILEKRTALKVAAEQLAKELKDLDVQIISILAGRDEAMIDGFIVTNKIMIRKEHVVKEAIFAVLKVKKAVTVQVTA